MAALLPLASRSRRSDVGRCCERTQCSGTYFDLCFVAGSVDNRRQRCCCRHSHPRIRILQAGKRNISQVRTPPSVGGTAVGVYVARDVGPAGIASAAGVPRKMRTRCSPMLKKLLQAVAPQKAARIIIMSCEVNTCVYSRKNNNKVFIPCCRSQRNRLRKSRRNI